MDGKFVQVDEHYQTTINHVYAIGDLVRAINLHIRRVHMDYMLLKLYRIKTNASISKQYYTLYLYSS